TLCFGTPSVVWRSRRCPFPYPAACSLHLRGLPQGPIKGDEEAPLSAERPRDRADVLHAVLRGRDNDDARVDQPNGAHRAAHRLDGRRRGLDRDPRAPPDLRPLVGLGLSTATVALPRPP